MSSRPGLDSRRVVQILVAHFKRHAIKDTSGFQFTCEVAQLSTVDDLSRSGLFDVQKELQCAQHDPGLMQELITIGIGDAVQSIK